MKLRTSFFNGAVLRKNLIRFAPVWALCAVAEVLGLMTMNLQNAGGAADDLAQIMGPVGIAHGIYALIVAACLFGDLFDSRLCNGLHAMPMRREGWLLTNLLSGLAFALIPAVVGGTVAAIAFGEFFWMALLWQASSLLQFVFFFGLAVYSAMCAGKRIGMIAIYVLLNFLSMLIYWVADRVFAPLLPGVILSADWFELFCPMVSMAGDSYVDFYYDKILGGFFKGFVTRDWYYLYICAGIGLLFLVLAWLLYRRRHLETAGDFISFRPMRVFFLLAYTFAAGVLVYSSAELFFGTYREYGFLAVGILMGWFTGWMLLERTVRIFTKKMLLSFLVFVLLFAGSIGLTVLDPAGIAAYIPETGKIKNACIYADNDTYYYAADRGWSGWYITDPAEIRQVQQLHRQMIETGEEERIETIAVNVRYELESGIRVCRKYQIPAGSKTAEDVKWMLSDMRAVFSAEDTQAIWDTVDYVHIYRLGESHGNSDLEIKDPQQKQALLKAIQADCAAGNFAQHDYFHLECEQVSALDITWEATWDSGKAKGTRSEYLAIYADCTNVIAFLETLEEN